MREAAFDKLHCSFERNAGWRDEQVDVVRHHYKGVEKVPTLAAVVLQSLEEEVGVAFDPEEKLAVGDD